MSFVKENVTILLTNKCHMDSQILL